MSYILDALKRADAERERGHVPGLHTRSTPSIDAPATQTGRWAQHARLMALGMLVVVVLLLGAALWWLRAAQPATPAVAAAAPTATASLAPAVAPLPLPAAALPTPAPPEPADNASRLVSEPAPPVLPILSPTPPPAPVKAAASPPAVPAANAQVTPKPPASATAAPKNTSATVATTSPTATAVQSFAELSPEARARLPTVNVSGSTYSKNPTLRMLIVNGKVVQEGGEIAPGLALETIEPRSAVLNHQGLRYRIGY